MKLKDLTLEQWNDLLREFMAAGIPADKLGKPIGMRCENSQLTTGWHCGGFTMYGETYIAVNPLDAQGNGVMFAVREDFAKWAKKRLKEIKNVFDDGMKQGELGI